MNRLDLYGKLKTVLCGRGVGRKIVHALKVRPTLHQKFSAYCLKRKVGITSQVLFDYLRGTTTKCVNPKCAEAAKFDNFAYGYFPMCSGYKCSSRWLEKTDRFRAYREKVTTGLLEKQENAVAEKGSGVNYFGYAFSSALRSVASIPVYLDIYKNLNGDIKPKTVFDHLWPKARKTCKNPGCTKPVKFVSFRYENYCCASCAMSDPIFEAGRKETYLLRSGGKYHSAMQDPEVAAKQRAAMHTTELKLSGGKRTSPTQRPEVKLAIVESARRTARERSGGKFNHHMENPEVVKGRARRELVRSKGRYSNSSQRPEVFAKINRSNHKYRTVKYGDYSWRIQGYEDIALRLMIKQYGVDPALISVPTHGLRFADSEGKLRRYFPDFFVDGAHPFFIEVKSLGTLMGFRNKKANNKEPFLHYRVHEKLQACVDHDIPVLLLTLTPNRSQKSKKSSYVREGVVLNYAFVSTTRRNFDLKFSIAKVDKIFTTMVKGKSCP